MRIMRIARNQSHSITFVVSRHDDNSIGHFVELSSSPVVSSSVSWISLEILKVQEQHQVMESKRQQSKEWSHERAMNSAELCWTLNMTSVNTSSNKFLIHLISIGYWMLKYAKSLNLSALGSDSWSVECAATPQLAVLGTWQWIFFSQELPADERLMNLSLRLYEHHMMACPK